MHLIGLLLLLILCPHGVFALWPAPGHVETGSAVLRLSRTFKIEVRDRTLLERAGEIGDVSSINRRADQQLAYACSNSSWTISIGLSTICGTTIRSDW